MKPSLLYGRYAFVYRRGGIMKKLTILTALLAMLLTAFTPLVLAQQTPPSDVPARDLGAPSLDTPAPGSTVGCQNLYGFLQLSAR
jgi:hypothetical protein